MQEQAIFLGAVTSEQLGVAKQEYSAGRDAFERGRYGDAVRSLERANALVSPGSRFGGEVQIWLATAYEAAGQRSEAIALCANLSRHPDPDTRKQSRRLKFILEAPALSKRKEWLVEIPDMSQLEDSDPSNQLGSAVQAVKRSPKPKPKPEPEPIDLSQVNTQDNRFIWLALGLAVVLIGGLVWLS